MQIEITGGTAELRDRANVHVKKDLKAAFADVTEVMRRKYSGSDITQMKSAADVRQDGEFTDTLDNFGMRALVVLMTSWTRPEAMPTSVKEWLVFEEPEDAPELYQELVNKVTPVAYRYLGMGNVEVSPETVRDPESPTVLSSDLSVGELAATTP